MIDKSAQVDSDGWEVRFPLSFNIFLASFSAHCSSFEKYALNWSTQWGAKAPTSLVRRRKWNRTRMRLPQQVSSEDLLSKVPADIPDSKKISVYDREGTFSGYYLLL